MDLMTLICIARMKVTEGEPATVNDDTIAEAARTLAPEAGFELGPTMRSCGSDDFGFYGLLAPTLMVFVGLNDAPGAERLSLHHPRFLPPPEAVSAVARAQAVAVASGVRQLHE